MKRNYGAGVVGGLCGGLVFGLIMANMGSMPLIAKLVGSDSAGVGWLVHLVIAALIGAFYAWWFGPKSTSLATGAGFGVIHGAIWWVLGALTIMPLWLGMEVQYANAFTTPNLISLLGHGIYGVICGLVYVSINKPKRR